MYFFAGYCIFGRDVDLDELELYTAEHESHVWKEVEDAACNEWVSYGGLHGCGFDEEAWEEIDPEDMMSQAERDDYEWGEAQNSVNVVVYSEEEYRKALSKFHDQDEIEKIILDMKAQA